MPRPLSVRERDVLDLLLSVDFPGAEELREQAVSVKAEGGGGLVVQLLANEPAPFARVVSRTPVEATVEGQGYSGGVLLFVDEGRLSALEHRWVTEDPPDSFPPGSAVQAPRAAM
jgi:hypothetical protein